MQFLGDNVITTKLIQLKNSKNYYTVNVEDIGNFKFYAQPISKKMPYIGEISDFSNQLILRRLRFWEHTKLDDACRAHNFFFIGAKN
jgi:hypothetical protein